MTELAGRAAVCGRGTSPRTASSRPPHGQRTVTDLLLPAVTGSRRHRGSSLSRPARPPDTDAMTDPRALGRHDSWDGVRAVVAGFGVSGFAAADNLTHIGASVTALADDASPDAAGEGAAPGDPRRLGAPARRGDLHTARRRRPARRIARLPTGLGDPGAGEGARRPRLGRGRARLAAARPRPRHPVALRHRHQRQDHDRSDARRDPARGRPAQPGRRQRRDSRSWRR